VMISTSRKRETDMVCENYVAQMPSILSVVFFAGSIRRPTGRKWLPARGDPATTSL